MPAMSSSVVVLPQPDGPSSATNSPLLTSRSSASSAVTCPNRFVSSSSCTRIVGSSLALEPAAVDLHQPVLGDEEDDENRQDVVEADSGQQSVVDESTLAQDRADQGAERLLRAAGHEDEWEQELVPPLDEREQAECEEAGLHERQHHPPPGLEPPGAIDECRHLEIPRNRVEKALHDPDAKRQLEGRLDQDHADQLIVEA